MKLYEFKPAPNPRRVRMFIAEKGLDIPMVQINLRGGEHFGAEYRNVVPRCVVPALELDDGTVITESVAICAYLEALYPDPPLFGAAPADRGLTMMWQQRIELEGFQGVVEYLRNGREAFKDRALPGPDPVPQIPDLAERGAHRAAHFMTLLDEQLSGKSYVIGDSFTIADISAFVFMQFATFCGVQPPEGLNAVQDWMVRVSARPSAEV